MSRKSTPDIMGNLMSERSCPIEVEPVIKQAPMPKEVAAPVVPKVKTELATTTELFAENSLQKGLPEGWTRATFIIRNEFNEKIKAIAYWDRLTVKEVVHDALAAYLQDRNVKPVNKKRLI